jgi:hypothetical protein
MTDFSKISYKKDYNNDHLLQKQKKSSDKKTSKKMLKGNGRSISPKSSNCKNYSSRRSYRTHGEEEEQDTVLRYRVESSHNLLMKCLESFLPTSTQFCVLTKGQQYTLKLNNTNRNSSSNLIDITLLLHRDVPKILLSTTVYERIQSTEFTLDSSSKLKRTHDHKVMLTTMMKFNSILNSNDITCKKGIMEQKISSSYDGKFVYLQHVDVTILEEPTSSLHRILESFILKSTELCLDFHRIERVR